jgi:hypothetical protein
MKDYWEQIYHTAKIDLSTKHTPGTYEIHNRRRRRSS